MSDLCFLVDLKTGEVFSEINGWNRVELSLKRSHEWAKIIYQRTSFDTAEKETWKNRRIYQVPIPVPAEQELYT